MKKSNFGMTPEKLKERRRYREKYDLAKRHLESLQQTLSRRDLSQTPVWGGVAAQPLHVQLQMQRDGINNQQGVYCGTNAVQNWPCRSDLEKYFDGLHPSPVESQAEQDRGCREYVEEVAARLNIFPAMYLLGPSK